MSKERHKKYDVTFSNLLKTEVRKQQDHLCFSCGHQPQLLEIHHKLPQAMVKMFSDIGVLPNVIKGFAEYIKSPKNAVGLCHNCHKDWNIEAYNDALQHREDMIRGGDIFLRKGV